MGVCISLRQDDISGYETIPQMYIGLGIRADAASGLTLNSAAGTGPIDISVLMNAEAMQCFNTLISNNRSLSSNVNQAIDMVEYFRGRGNKDGDEGRDLITNAEIEDYVNSYINTLPEPRPTLAAEVAGVRNTLTQFVALVRHVSSTTTPSLPAGVPVEGTRLAADSVSSYETISHMFIGLGIRRGENGVHLNAESSLGTGGVRLTDLSIERLTAMAAGNEVLLANIRDTRSLIDSLQTDSRFNADNDATVISDRDLEAYCRLLARVDRSYNAAEEQAGLARAINALRGLIVFASAPPPAPPRDETPPPPAPEPTFWASVWNWMQSHPIASGIIGGGAILAAGLGIRHWLRRGDGETPPPANASRNSSVPEARAEDRSGAVVRPEDRMPTVLSDTSTPPPATDDPRVVSDISSPPPAADHPRVVSDTSHTSVPPPADDIAAELAKIAGDRSPAGGALLPDAVTHENVIMAADSTPETRLDRNVVKAQIVLTYREFFMSQAAREALAEGRPLPTGESLINSAYAHYVDVLTDDVMAEFSARSRSNAAEIGDMWDAQRDRDFLPRRGVPDRLLVEVTSRRITEWTTASTPGFSSDAPRDFGVEAERRLRNTDSFRRGMVDLLRDPVRIGR